jgi:hypothetical protein
VSVVTNLIFAHHHEDDALVAQVHDWFELNAYTEGARLVDVNDAPLRSHRVFEQHTLVGAFNHFDLDGFVKFVRSLPWAEPENVQIIVREQHDARYRIITAKEGVTPCRTDAVNGVTETLGSVVI